MKFLIAWVLALAPTFGMCEVYLGIAPFANLQEVRALFPGAKVEKLAPAWAQESDAMYKFTGRGLTGSIVVKFNDRRPEYKARWNSAPEDKKSQFLEQLMNASDDEALVVDWVRWMPDQDVPLTRLVSKYGKPAEAGFSDSDFKPYRSWPNRGVVANLSDDEKFVLNVEFSFTPAEESAAWQRILDSIPKKPPEASGE